MHRNANYRFLERAESVGSGYVTARKYGVTQVEEFNLHVPYDQAWSEAVSELCTDGTWRLSGTSRNSQTFDLNGKCSISIVPGRVDKNLDFIEGTDTTDTYVVVRTVKG